MGQKSNPNSFQLSKKANNVFSSSFNSLEYSNFLKDYLSISSNLISFFEKNNCLVKDCHIMLNNDKSFLTIFISFLVLNDISKKQKDNLLDTSFILNNFWAIFNKFGYLNHEPIIKLWEDHIFLNKNNSSKLWPIIMWQSWLENNNLN